MENQNSEFQENFSLPVYFGTKISETFNVLHFYGIEFSVPQATDYTVKNLTTVYTEFCQKSKERANKIFGDKAGHVELPALLMIADQVIFDIAQKIAKKF